MTQIRVLQVISRLGMGGAETWLMELLRRWSGPAAPVAMDFLLLSGKRGHFDDEAASLGARLFYVPFSRATLGHFYSRFGRILAQGCYDAVHDHADLSSGWRSAFPSRAMPRVRIAHVHNPVYQLSENYGTDRVRRMNIRISRLLVSRRATLVLGTSAQLLEEYGFYGSTFQGVPKQVLHCGFSLSRFAGPAEEAARSLREEFGWPEETLVVLFAGRLDGSLRFDHPQNHKNSAFALQVFRAARTLNPKLKMLMAGENTHVRERFEHLVQEQGLGESVRLLGVRDDIERLMLGSSVLLFPSRAEGLGMVAVEAQAAGLPVVASTAVPREAAVLSELVHFLPDTDPASSWGRVVAELAASPRPRPTIQDERWLTTGFNLEVSARSLELAYRGVV